MQLVIDIRKEKYSFIVTILNIDNDEISFLKAIRQIFYKFQYFIYSIQIEDLKSFSLKIKYKDFHRFPCIFLYGDFLSENNWYNLKEDNERKYLRFSMKAFNLYKEKEKDLFDSMFKRFGKFVQITE
jgi:hypothetical protein